MPLLGTPLSASVIVVDNVRLAVLVVLASGVYEMVGGVTSVLSKAPISTTESRMRVNPEPR